MPVLTAARSLGIPTLIHESNAIPGVANRFLNRFATRTAVGLAATNSHLRKARHRDRDARPLRVLRDTAPRPGRDDPPAARVGGSQGSRVINRAMARAAVLLERRESRSSTRRASRTRRDPPAVHPRPGKLEARALPPEAPRRDGLGRPRGLPRRSAHRRGARRGRAAAILVPFRRRGPHQIYNARALYQKGAAALMEERNLTAENLAGAITEKLKDREQLSHGSEARRLAKPDAAKDLAKLIFALEGRAVRFLGCGASTSSGPAAWA